MRCTQNVRQPKIYMNKYPGTLLAIVAALWVTLASAASAAPGEPTYVIFSIMGPQALGPENINGIIQPESTWHDRENGSVEELVREFGRQKPGQQRYIGFSIALTPTLNLTETKLKAEVVHALDLAEQAGIPVFLHLDDQHFWFASPELAKNPEMQEWSDFPKEGQRTGPVVPRYWLNWGDPAAVYPAPPPCFACPAFKTALSRRLKKCVAEPVVERLNNWKKQGKEYLFAGIASGNETSVPDFHRGYDGYTGKPGEEAGLDITRRPPVKIKMSNEDRVPVGYHSLHSMGYNRKSIENLAQSRHESVNKTTKELFYQVAHDYAELQAKTLSQAGIPKDRIYTHFTSTTRTLKGYGAHVRELEEQTAASTATGSDNLAPPVPASVNQYSRPGFSVVRSAVDLNELVAQLQRAHAQGEGKTWAAVESYACSGQPGKAQTQEQYEEYLGGLTAHGAKVVNVYGWNIDIPSPYAVKGSGVVPAVKKWLTGHNFSPAWFGSQNNSQLKQAAAIQTKIAIMQQNARDLVGKGLDPHAVQAILASFQSQFEPLVRAGKFAEAEAAIDRAIAQLKALR